MLDLSIVPNVKGQSHLPIIVDPSHATGRPRPDPGDGPGGGGRRLPTASTSRCIAAPRRRFPTAPRRSLPDQYARLMDELRQLAELMGKTIDVCEGEPV